MLLTVDIGNSFIKAGLWRGSALAGDAPLRLPTNHVQTDPALWQNALTNAAQTANLSRDLAEVNAVVIASVVPALTPVWAEIARQLTGDAPLLISAQTDTGLQSAYQTQADLGADRWVNAFAAHAELPPDEKNTTACVVVDFGTATKWEAVSPGGVYLGGAIAPGVGTSRDALFARAAQLFGVPLKIPAPVPAIGTNTEAALQAGILRGNAAQSDGIIASMMREMNVAPPLCRVWATGGFADIIAPHCQTKMHRAPHLTLNGLRLLHERA